MMKKSVMLIHLLLQSLVIHEAQGVRLVRKGSLTYSQQPMSHNGLAEMNNEDVVVEEANSMWKSKHFSGNARKLMEASSISTATSIAENENDKKKEKTVTKEENLSVDASSTTEQRRPRPAAAETYPDILDIAGMDYSQARRKPPIHN